MPEIYDGIVEVKAVARDPGSRAKIAVISRDSSVDPVGACVGMRGSRVQAVVNELQGEKIDIIPWSPDIATFVVNALAPAEVAKVVLDEDKERIEVVVPDQQLSLAIGRRGQNVRLASQLTGWDIDILTEQEESERRQAEFENRTKIFVEALNLDEVVGQLLASEGFGSIEELALVDEKEIAGIEGFDEDTARELQERAREYLDKQEAELDAKRKELGVEDAVKEVPGITTAMLVKLGENGVKTVEDLAGCATDDLDRLDRAQGRRVQARAGLPRRLRRLARGRRSPDHAGARESRLGHRGRARPAGRAGRSGAGREAAEARGVRSIDTGMLATAQDDRARPRGAMSRPGTERTCALTREVKPVAELIRFVVGPDGAVVPDVKRKLPGRGIWITGTRGARRARRSSAMCSPAASSATCARPPICAARDRAAAGARRARRAGDGRQGRARRDRFRQSRGGARPGRRSGADPRRRRRRRRQAQADAALRAQNAEKSREIAVIDAFTGGQLDLALNRPNVVHAALLAGPGSETFLARAERLERFRTGQFARCGQRACADGRRTRTEYGMSETKNPGEKKLSVGKLTLKPRTETGVVRQSFSHGRSKQVVVEKVKRRSIGGAPEAKAEPAPAEAPKTRSRAPPHAAAARRRRRSAESRPASCCAR